MVLLCITTETSKCFILHYDTHYEYLIEIGFRILNDVHYQFMLSNVYGRNVSWHPTAYIPLQRKTSRVEGGGGGGSRWTIPPMQNFTLGITTCWYLKTQKFALPQTRTL